MYGPLVLLQYFWHVTAFLAFLLGLWICFLGLEDTVAPLMMLVYSIDIVLLLQDYLFCFDESLFFTLILCIKAAPIYVFISICKFFFIIMDILFSFIILYHSKFKVLFSAQQSEML